MQTESPLYCSDYDLLWITHPRHAFSVTIFHNPTAFNCQKAEQQIPPGIVRFMYHVSQRLDCPLKDMVINALYVIARRWNNPLHQSGTQDIHSYPKITNQLSGCQQSAQYDAHFNNTVLVELHEASVLKSNIKLLLHTLVLLYSWNFTDNFEMSCYILYILVTDFFFFDAFFTLTGIAFGMLYNIWQSLFFS